ncbi:MAG: molybdate ABC transporter substrate-binding protein [Dehalococcoidia bacterium]|nr:molybdate ABC transporter substrate-binding protein [Dehalococcoidia bacterium]MDD5647657.1 molybdate ABC transporter substrate-binding protein [Dehalococcoidia bacterium]
MQSKFTSCISIGLLLIVLLCVGCSASAVTVNVSAAASLTDVITEINALYQKENPNVTVIANYAGSGTLQQQIENGAPADVFISASPKQIDALQSKNLIVEDTRKDLLCNKVVLIVPGDSTLEIKSFNDLTGDSVKKVSIGDPDSVPAGQYARDILNQFDIMETLKPKLVLASNVRQVLQYVESSNVDAGIVFLTDAKISKSVKVVADAPDDINQKVLYPVAVINTGKDTTAALAYETFLFSDQAAAIFDKYGFTVIKPKTSK